MTTRDRLPACVLAGAVSLWLGLMSAAVASSTGAAGERSGSPPAPASGSRTGVLPPGARVSERLFGLPGLSNVGRIAPGIYRGAQPEPAGYQTLRAMGVRTVVNLRLRHGERAAVEAAGMRSIEIPMPLTRLSPASVKRIVALMADPAIQPVFVHCAQGRDRTGVVVAVYRMDVDGWSKAEAEAEMQAFGFNDVWRSLKAFVRDYPGAGGAPPPR